MRTIWLGVLAVAGVGAAGWVALQYPPVAQWVAAWRGQETAVEHALKHLNPRYVCPMHPQIVRDAPGDCPICGMTLVPVENKPTPEQASREKKVLYWVAPMDPTYRRDRPGKSPMGMDLVPVYEEGPTPGSVEDATVVTVGPEVVNNLGVRTVAARRGTLGRRIETVGYVDFDETRISHVHTRTEGWIERLLVRSEGERVSKGQLLFELYSPTLVNAQEEMVQALASQNDGLIRASRERLRALGVPEDQIRQLGRTRRVDQVVRTYAEQDGVIRVLNVREGMYVTPATEVMSLADLSSVWLLAEVFERQTEWVKVGAPAEIRLTYLPGRTWRGQVEYVYPDLDPKTRTLKARLRFDNPDQVLKPNMYADVVIYGQQREDVLTVPREAIIRTGEGDRVVLALGQGRFRPVPVVVGIESGDSVEVREGLHEGDRVVISGQFLIDSESSLQASFLRMNATHDKNDDSVAEGAP